MLQAVTRVCPNLQSANISYSMQKRLIFKIGYVCEIPWGGGVGGGGYDHLPDSLIRLNLPINIQRMAMREFSSQQNKKYLNRNKIRSYDFSKMSKTR